MVACVPTIVLFAKARRWIDLVSAGSMAGHQVTGERCKRMSQQESRESERPQDREDMVPQAPDLILNVVALAKGVDASFGSPEYYILYLGPQACYKGTPCSDTGYHYSSTLLLGQR
eukprot:CAMPEP_0119116670 /NCGR_PEP_ID=MMETSP1180-20130426/52414_1 /TAXON_ID=3052 ORGANISM="Chlamydomonas cf sp, Strain CCMP681" /NCGR_SAMPLE_ID=MMETSP1180 /ASSEMBLY_ACC=CAM_ASM_000741 /LENGTH=115 /DNA_ID=CAMNT_0007105849 /DNA_START=326 /DNA_END=674 /DNA_ORIENTATION=+